MLKLVPDTNRAYFYQESPGSWRLICFIQNTEKNTFHAFTAALPVNAAGNIKWMLCEPGSKAWTVYDAKGQGAYFTIDDTNTTLTRYTQSDGRMAGPVFSKEELTKSDKARYPNRDKLLPADLSHPPPHPLPEEAESILHQVQEQDTINLKLAQEKWEKAAEWSKFRKRMEFPSTEEKSDFPESLSQELEVDLNTILGSPDQYATPEEAVTALTNLANHFAWIKEMEPNSRHWKRCKSFDIKLEQGRYFDINLLQTHKHVYDLIRRKIDHIHQTVFKNNEPYPTMTLETLEKNRIYHQIFSGNPIPLSKQIEAAGNGLIEWLIDNHLLEIMAINRKDPEGNTLLHYMVGAGNNEATTLLIASSANINIQNQEGQTPLHIAVDNGNAALADTLLEAKAQLNVQDCRGQTPLHIAVDNGNATLVSNLLTGLAQPNIPDLRGRTPLHIAIAAGKSDIAAILRRAGADIIPDFTPSETDLFLGNFQKIYAALYEGQSGLFKSRFRRYTDIQSIFQYAAHNPNSRTAKAVELTAKYLKRDAWADAHTHTQLFRDVYAYAFSQGSWFGISNAAGPGRRFWNFFAKPLRDNIQRINPPEDAALQDPNDNRRSVKIERALRG